MQQNQPGWEPPVSNVFKDYVESGKVRFVTLYSIGHSGGHPAQIVAWCLNEQKSDFYWQFYAKAFANLDDVEDAAKMRTLAGTVSGIDTKKLDSCIASNKYDSRFDEEQAVGAQLGMSGTPGFIIGKSDGSDLSSVVRGAYPYSTFQQLIEARL
jgi:protein-disulfide isomerase